MPELQRLPFLSLHTLLFLLRVAVANPVPQTSSGGSHLAQSYRVSELQFKEKLENPCAFLESNYTFAIHEDLQAVLRDISYQTFVVQQASHALINSSVLKDCSNFEMPSVAVIPSLNDVKDDETVDALGIFYTSLINHTAHMYFLLEQLDHHSSDVGCASTRNADFAKKARTLAVNMRQLMCTIRVGGGALGSPSLFEESTNQILEEELVNQPLCSRRTIRDCQTASSTVTLVNIFCAYLRSQIQSS